MPANKATIGSIKKAFNVMEKILSIESATAPALRPRQTFIDAPSSRNQD
jgi:hypothetical protein